MSWEPEGGQEGLFKRRSAVVPRRRRRLLMRLVKPFGGALAIVALPAALGAWILTSPQFLVSELAIASAGRVSPVWIENRLQAILGRHVLAVRLADVEARLAAHPWIESVEMRKELPGRLEVTVRQRRPAAIRRDGEGAVFLDRSGEEIAPLDGEIEGLDLVVIGGSPSPMSPMSPTSPILAKRAIELADEWRRLRPGDSVSEIDVLGPRDFRVDCGSLPFDVLIGGGELGPVLTGLERALPLITHRYPEVGTVDLRFDQQIVFQPAVLPPITKG